MMGRLIAFFQAGRQVADIRAELEAMHKRVSRLETWNLNTRLQDAERRLRTVGSVYGFTAYRDW